jgi:recombination protein RecA
MAHAAHDRSLAAREALRAWSSSSVTTESLLQKRQALQVAAPLSSVLPEGGFPKGSVVELASPANLGHGLGVALAACAAAQRASLEHGGQMAWCAFLDPDRTLFGPAVQASGVCLERLLVLRPARSLLAKVAVRVALARIFSVIVVDVAAVPGVLSPSKALHRSESMDAWGKVTRRLSLAVEKTPTTVFLLTRSEALRSSALPAAMRVELESGGPGSLSVRVAKEKFGRVTSPRQIVWTRPRPSAAYRTESG